MKISILILAFSLIFLKGTASADDTPAPMPAKVMQKTNGSSLMEIPFADAKGTTETLSQYKGKAIVVVNVASKCGYTKQYAELEELYKKYEDKGLVIVGFPSNDYGGQEPGTNAEIQMFCKSEYGVTFPVKGKLPTKGDAKSPLYVALTGPNAAYPGEIGWNFEKFVIGRNGNVIARFKSKTTPMSAELTAAVEKALQQ